MTLFVNGEEVPEALLQAEAQSLHARFAQLTPDQRAQYGFDDATLQQRAIEWGRENVIERVLLRQEALKASSPIGDEVLAQAVEQMKQRYGGADKLAQSGLTEETIRDEAVAAIRLERLLNSIRKLVKAPTLKEIGARYRKTPERWLVGESVRAAHIVKHINEEVTEQQAREAIDQAKAELDGGADFAELADRVSDCPGNGGDLGWFGPGKMVEEFEAVVFEMEPGEVSDVFKSVFGFHLAKLHEKKPPTTLPLSEVKDRIATELIQERENQLVEGVVDKLRAAAKIEVREPVKV